MTSEAQRKKDEATKILKDLADAVESDSPPTHEEWMDAVQRARDLLLSLIVELEVEP